MTIVFFLDIYYCIIIAWTIFYLIATFVRLPGLPWQTCGTLGTLIWFVLLIDEPRTGYSKTDIGSQVTLRLSKISVFHSVDRSLQVGRPLSKASHQMSKRFLF